MSYTTDPSHEPGWRSLWQILVVGLIVGGLIFGLAQPCQGSLVESAINSATSISGEQGTQMVTAAAAQI